MSVMMMMWVMSRMMMMSWMMVHCGMVMSNDEALVSLVETVIHHRGAQSCSHARARTPNTRIMPRAAGLALFSLFFLVNAVGHPSLLLIVPFAAAAAAVPPHPELLVLPLRSLPPLLLRYWPKPLSRPLSLSAATNPIPTFPPSRAIKTL